MGTIAIAQGDMGYVVRMMGRGTLREGRAMVECINRANLDGARRFTVDLSQTEYLDSTCLGSLVALHQRFNANGAQHFQVAAEKDHLKRLFGQTRLDQIIPRMGEAITLTSWHDIPAAVIDGSTLAEFVIDCHRQLAATGGSDSASFLLVADMLARQERAKNPLATN